MPVLYLSNAGAYAYMEHLVALDSMRPQSGLVPEELSRIVTPLHWQVWDRKLSQHPDQRFRSYIVEGFRYGFRVGFDYTRPLKSATSNMSSSRHHPQLISEYLAEECAEGRIMGPLARDFSTKVHVSSFGLIPKKTPAIHPADHSLLGMVWEGKLFIDTALSFGPRSAPKVFTAVADAAEWIAQQEGVDRIIHYLDDFLVVGPPKSDKCKQHIDKVLELAGGPVQAGGSCHVLVFSRY